MTTGPELTSDEIAVAQRFGALIDDGAQIITDAALEQVAAMDLASRRLGDVLLDRMIAALNYQRELRRLTP